MLNQTSFTMVNPQNGHQAFKLFSFSDNSFFDQIQRNNFFTLIWVTKGSGKVKADVSEYDFEENSLFSFAPYQPYMLSSDGPMEGIAIYFHFDFFCIHKHHKDLELNGVLYNNVFLPPFIKVDEKAAATFAMVCDQIKTEMQNPALAQYELLVTYLKIFLITATRLKVEQQAVKFTMTNDNNEPFILQKLKDAIETNFRTKHSASDYADLLYISPKALAKMAKSHFNKTISSLINERIIIEAKRELYLTNKTVKEIAYELGYEDEYYFSRFFKTNAEVSPQNYRATVGFGKGES
jgi:AraC-like DNA-binding protein